jgi:hypothetical protein
MIKKSFNGFVEQLVLNRGLKLAHITRGEIVSVLGATWHGITPRGRVIVNNKTGSITRSGGGSIPRCFKLSDSQPSNEIRITSKFTKSEKKSTFYPLSNEQAFLAIDVLSRFFRARDNNKPHYDLIAIILNYFTKKVVNESDVEFLLEEKMKLFNETLKRFPKGSVIVIHRMKP